MAVGTIPNMGTEIFNHDMSWGRFNGQNLKANRVRNFHLYSSIKDRPTFTEDVEVVFITDKGQFSVNPALTVDVNEWFVEFIGVTPYTIMSILIVDHGYQTTYLPKLQFPMHVTSGKDFTLRIR